jgi:uncharacterized membrane protein
VRNEQREEQIIGLLLRIGVMLAAAVIFAGAALYLGSHGMEHPQYLTFHGVPDSLKRPWPILKGAVALDGRAVIQLGLLLLIATPVARVAFSVVVFRRQRDWTYVGITVFVLVVLASSLIGGN